MIEKSKRPSSGGNAAPESRGLVAESAQTQANQPIAVSQATQPATAAQNQALTPDRALREFREIANRLRVVTSLFSVQPLQEPCPSEGRWCLPDVNCTARITFSQTAQDAFLSNQLFCGNEAPVLDLDSSQPGNSFSATQARLPVAIAHPQNATITDEDSPNLSSLTVKIGNLIDGEIEELSANTSGTSINASYDRDNGILKLTESDTVTNYQKVLRTITYDNTGGEGRITTPRIINFVANDGILVSNTATTTVTIEIIID